MKRCRRCKAETPLPYMCRACWTLLGPRGQVRFYHRLRGASMETIYGKGWREL
jgi:hypothetical protein